MISLPEIKAAVWSSLSLHFFASSVSTPKIVKGKLFSSEVAGITEEAMQVVAQGEFSNIRNNPILQNMYFSPVEARYFKLKATRMVDESDSLGIAEIGCR